MKKAHRARNELLQMAQDLMEEHGWVQGVFKNDSGFCARGALREARLEMRKHRLFDSESRESAFRAAWDALNAEVFFEGFRTLSAWNDSPRRTKDEVLYLFASVHVGG